MRAIKTTTISILAVGLLAGSAVGVAAQDEEAAEMPAGSASFTGTYGWTWPELERGTTTWVDGVEQMRGVVMADSIETTDARVTGAVLRAENVDVHDVSGRDETVVPKSVTWHIENDGGSWTGQGYELHGWGADAPDMGAFGVTVLMLTGEEGYEGLSAYLAVDWSTGSESTPPTVHGGVFPGEAPPFPEVPSATE